MRLSELLLHKLSRQKMLDEISRQGMICVLFSCAVVSVYAAPSIAQVNQNTPTITERQAKALKTLTQPQSEMHQVKNLRVHIKKLSDSQGQVYLAAVVSRADLLPYLTQLKDILQDDFQVFRAHQAARDQQLFHMTLLTPQEYQLADHALIETLLASNVAHDMASQLKITLLGLGTFAQGSKKTFFVVAQSSDGQLLRQRFLLPTKDFHVTLGFNPTDIYGVKKDRSTLIE